MRSVLQTCCDKYVLYQTVYLLCRYYRTIFVMSDRLELVYICFHANSVNFLYCVHAIPKNELSIETLLITVLHEAYWRARCSGLANESGLYF